jgi:hypothetical protein
MIVYCNIAITFTNIELKYHDLKQIFTKVNYKHTFQDKICRIIPIIT